MLGNYSFLVKAIREYVERTDQMGQQMQQNPDIYGQTLAGVGSLASLYKLSQ